MSRPQDAGRPMAEASLTSVQGQLMQWVIGHFDGAPSAEAFFLLFDPRRGPTLSSGGTTDKAGLLFAAGLVLLRRAHEGLLDQEDWPQRGAMREALQTALRFREASGVAEPVPSRTVRQ